MVAIQALATVVKEAHHRHSPFPLLVVATGRREVLPVVTEDQEAALAPLELLQVQAFLVKEITVDQTPAMEPGQAAAVKEALVAQIQEAPGALVVLGLHGTAQTTQAAVAVARAIVPVLAAPEALVVEEMVEHNNRLHLQQALLTQVAVAVVPHISAIPMAALAGQVL